VFSVFELLNLYSTEAMLK